MFPQKGIQFLATLKIRGERERERERETETETETETERDRDRENEKEGGRERLTELHLVRNDLNKDSQSVRFMRKVKRMCVGVCVCVCLSLSLSVCL